MVRLRFHPNVLPSIDETAIDNVGGDCSGGEGAGRVLTLSNTSLTTGLLLFVNGVFLHPTHDYAVSHKAASSTVTFVGDVWNDDFIDGYYFT